MNDYRVDDLTEVVIAHSHKTYRLDMSLTDTIVELRLLSKTVDNQAAMIKELKDQIEKLERPRSMGGFPATGPR